MSDTEQYQRVLARHGRTFYLASRLLPAQVRDDSALLYAFCRFVDDTADEATDPKAAKAALAGVMAQLQGQAAPSAPLISDTRRLFTRVNIPLEAAFALLEGVTGDLEARLVMADDGELLRYCYRVAGVVGLMMCGALGVKEPEARPYAIDLGLGMQLTNICRDVLEDAKRGRMYLPAARLAAKGLDAESCLDRLAAGTLTPAMKRGLQAVVGDLLALAERYYHSAAHGFRYLPSRVKPAIMAAGWMYRAIGRKLLGRACRVWDGRVVVSKPVKLAWVARALVAAPQTARWQQPHDPQLHLHLDGLPGAST